MSIRQRLLVTFTLITSLGGLLLFVVAGRQLEAATIEFYMHDLESEAITVAGTIFTSVGEYFDEEERQDSGDLQTLIDGIPIQSDHRIVLIDSSRRILADSRDGTKHLFERLQNTPELAAALDGKFQHDIRLDENGESTAYAAALIRYEHGIIGILRVSAPMEPAYAKAREGWTELATVVLPIVLLTAGASLWLGRKLATPIRQLQESSLRMAEGALDERIQVQSHDEIGQLGQAFNFMAERISMLLNAQRSFVSNAAHELRAPLMALKLRVEALQDPALSDEQRQTYLREADEQVRHMAELVSALLVLARLDENNQHIRKDSFDTAALLRDVARHWRIQAQQAGLVFCAEIPDELPDVPMASSDLRMVLDNLLSNAVKYTAHGQITLRAGDGAATFWVQVQDTGEGFSTEDTNRLFERFFRADRSHSQQIPGTGLGLSIVQSVLARYGGSIMAHSPGVGQGATFDVRVPLST